MQDGGFMFDSATIERMEMLILGALKWRMRSTNPFCFVNYFIPFLKLKGKPSIQALKNRATEIILKAQHDIKLLGFKPSIISASALLYATNDLCPIQFASFRKAVCSCYYVDKVCAGAKGGSRWRYTRSNHEGKRNIELYRGA